MFENAKYAILAASLVIAVNPAAAQETTDPEPPSQQNSAADVDALSAQQLQQFLMTEPELLAALGLAQGPVAIRVYSVLSPNDLEAINNRKAMLRQFRSQLDQFDPAAMNDQKRLSLEIWSTFLDYELAVSEFDYGVPLGGPYPVTHYSPTGLSDLMVLSHPMTNEAMAGAYVSRLSFAAETIKTQQAMMGLRADEGILPPKSILDKAITGYEELLAVAPEDNRIITRLCDEMPAGVDGAAAAALISQATLLMQDEIYPAYRNLLQSLRHYQPAARTENIGVGALPGGADFYAANIQRETTLTLAPDAIHQTGLSEVGRLTAAMDAKLAGLGYTEGSVLDRMAQLRAASSYDFKTPEDVSAYTARMVEKAREKSTDYLSRLPKAGVELRLVSSGPNRYAGPAADGSTPGYFSLNATDLSSISPVMYPSLIFHETIPGHHYQIALQRESDLPLLRKFLPFNSYSEGWGLYVETIAAEMGLYDGDPVGEIGALESELFRAVRLVVDTGLHAKGWSREQAADYFRQTLGGPGYAEIDRYLVNPAQALGYKMGQLKIAELRARAEQQLGNNFDVKAFHDQILANGPLPLEVLDREIDRWIAAQKD